MSHTNCRHCPFTVPLLPRIITPGGDHDFNWRQGLRRARVTQGECFRIIHIVLAIAGKAAYCLRTSSSNYKGNQMKQLFSVVILSLAFTFSSSSLAKMCPDGSYVSGNNCKLAPDGSYVGGKKAKLAPDGTYVGGDKAKLTPSGTYVGGSKSKLCPDGSYVAGTRCKLQPDGSYTGND